MPDNLVLYLLFVSQMPHGLCRRYLVVKTIILHRKRVYAALLFIICEWNYLYFKSEHKKI